MLYFKNSELTAKYHVALNTVLNWAKEAELGKLELELISVNGRNYIANTSRNLAVLDQLALERKKYRNSRTTKDIRPRPEFYRLFKKKQLYDLIRGIDTHHEIPRQYGYFGEGAHTWDRYVSRLAEEAQPNMLNRTVDLMTTNWLYIERLLSPYKRINIVDIGVGNGLPVRGLLERLTGEGRLGRYIALDVSAEMLNIAKVNIAQWFGDRVTFEGYETDINYDRFVHLLADEYAGPEAQTTVTLVLVLGSTLGNFRTPGKALRTIQSSMGAKDLLILTQKLDTPNSRNFFDFNASPSGSSLTTNHRFLVDQLGIDQAFYDPEMGYDVVKKQRFIRIRFKVSLQITFELPEGDRVVRLEKGETLLVWRYWQQNHLDVVAEFARNEFYPLLLSQTPDREYLLSISQINPDLSV
jgi:hypothetical protein